MFIAMATAICSHCMSCTLTAVPGSTQPCTTLGSLNRVLALAGVGRDVTSAGWQITLCDPMWHVSSRNSEAGCKTYKVLYSIYLLTSLFTADSFVID